MFYENTKPWPGVTLPLTDAEVAKIANEKLLMAIENDRLRAQIKLLKEKQNG